MKISKITIKQLFGIKEWQGDGKNIELVGDNGTGKTSVIDAIRYALTNSSDREFIVKNGETEGEIYIETDNGLSIDRKARTAMTDYKSVKQNGNVIPSPESFLKTIFTPLQLSPMEFISMDKKTQNATILDMIQYDWNLDTIKEWFGEIPRDVNYEQNILAVLNDIQAENGYYFMHRQDVNRDIRAKKAVIADIGSSLPIDYDGERWEKENLSDLYTEIEKIRKNNETIEKAKRLRDSHDGKIRSFQADKEIKIAALDTEMAQQEKNIESELAQLEERIKALKEKKDGLAGVKADKVKVIQSEYEASVSKYEAEQASYAEYADMETTPIDDLMAKANETEKMKGHINEWRRMLSIQKEVDELQSESNSLTEKIELARSLPGTILETAEIPIEGLTVKDGIAFIMSGIGVGLGACLSIVYAPTLTRNTASSVGMDVIIAIVFGGMPVSGGARSKIYAAVIGAFSMTLLSQIMVMFNLNSGIGQMVKAAIFILVVFLATSDQRGKMLPR